MSDTHGLFIWYELMTGDRAGAKAFYGDIVGWEYDDMPMGEGMTYTVAGPGRGVAGMMDFTPEARQRGIPPNWTGYVAVDEVDASTTLATQLGGSIHVPPTDIPGIGRFSVIADPQGAVIAIMTPAPMEESRPEPERGAIGTTSWHELYTSDLEAGFGFYETMFGWRKDEALDMGAMGTYQLFANAKGVIGGMMKRPPQMPVSAWLYYFQVGPIDEAAGKIAKGGGQVLMGPMEVPGGDWIIQGVDPQGAMFAVVGKKG